MSRYAELHSLSNFSFQRGASTAKELFERAAQLGYQALAITDECSLAGIVRAWQAAKASGVQLITGIEVQLSEGIKLVLLARDLTGYQNICKLVTLARRRSRKGCYALGQADFAATTEGIIALWVPGPRACEAHGRWVASMFPDACWISVQLHHGADDARQLADLQQLGARLQLPLVASGDVHMHARGRRALQDTLTAIGQHCTVSEAGYRLFPNGERHLRAVPVLQSLYPQALLDESVKIAAQCTFQLDELRYEYPHEVVPQGKTAASWLRELT